MGWFCDNVSILKEENAQLAKKVEDLGLSEDYLEGVNARLLEELNILQTQVNLYDQIMKGLRINVNLDGKKK